MIHTVKFNVSWGKLLNLIIVKYEKTSSLFPATYTNYPFHDSTDQARLTSGCYPITMSRNTNHIIFSKNSLTRLHIVPTTSSPGQSLKNSLGTA